MGFVYNFYLKSKSRKIVSLIFNKDIVSIYFLIVTFLINIRFPFFRRFFSEIIIVKYRVIIRNFFIILMIFLQFLFPIVFTFQVIRLNLKFNNILLKKEKYFINIYILIFLIFSIIGFFSLY